MSTTTTSPADAYRAARGKLGQLQLEAASLERRLQALHGRVHRADSSDRTTAAAEALLDGGTLSEASDFRAQLVVVRRAIDLQRTRVDDAKAERDAAILDEAEPGIHKSAQELGELAVALSEAADGLQAQLAELDSQGVGRLHRFPGLRLDPLRASVGGSRMNGFVDELERDYGVRVKRAERDRARKRRNVLQLEEVERQKQAGGLIAAGPDGVVEYARGGKPKKPPQRGRRAGSDDYKTIGRWSGV